MKRSILVLTIMVITMSISLLAASDDFFFKNTDMKVGYVFSSEIDGYGLQLGSFSHFTNTDHRAGVDLVWWFADEAQYFNKYRSIELNFNYNMILLAEEWYQFYPLASLGYHYHYREWRVDRVTYGRDKSDLAFGIGAGIQFNMPPVRAHQLTPLKIYIEPRYFFSGQSEFQITIGGSLRYPG